MSETIITPGPSCVTDAGLETDLIFHHGVDLPQFAAFPLLESEAGRALLRTYYAAFADIAARHDARLLLESPTWRANPDWGAKLGMPPPTSPGSTPRRWPSCAHKPRHTT